MTAHIDAENLETEVQECNPKDLHAMQQELRRVSRSRLGYMCLLGVSAFYNLIFTIVRILE